MALHTVAGILIVLSSLAASAQNDHMSSWLNDVKPQETVHRLTSLGVDQDVAEQVIVAKSPLIKWETIRSESGQAYAIMFLPCTALDAHLYLMVQKKEWRVNDAVDLECYYDDSVSFEIASIRKKGLDELLVHRASEAHGTGFSQQNFKVFNISDGKLKLVLDTEEVVSAYPLQGPWRQERSFFVVVPSNSHNPRVIEQTRSLLVGNKLSVQRRYFHWSPTAGRYLASGFTTVQGKED